MMLPSTISTLVLLSGKCALNLSTQLPIVSHNKHIHVTIYFALFIAFNNQNRLISTGQKEGFSKLAPK